MTDREKAIISAYTGIAMLTGDKFSIFHKYVEDILGRSVWTHELADRAIWDYHIRTGHNDWGNDSCESVESKDACCDECLSRFTQEWLKDEDVIHSDTAYIEINKARHVLKETDEDETDE